MRVYKVSENWGYSWDGVDRYYMKEISRRCRIKFVQKGAFIFFYGKYQRHLIILFVSLYASEECFETSWVSCLVPLQLATRCHEDLVKLLAGGRGL